MKINQIKLGIIMDPIQSINFYKDTTLALMLEAQQRGWQLWYMEQTDLFSADGKVYAWMRPIIVKNDAVNWFEFPEYKRQALQVSSLDIVLMRKDPPVDYKYIYTTQLLDLVAKQGTLVANNPQALRDFNEKTFITWFAQLCPAHLLTSNLAMFMAFANEHQHIVIKSLTSFGGNAVFKIHVPECNEDYLYKIFARFSLEGTTPVMLQRYIPDIMRTGDKRVFMINGEPYPYALARMPASGDFRGNLAVGAKGVGVKLTDNDLKICAVVGQTLRANRLYFVGLDIIGDYLTEINITCPTCVREVDREHGVNVSAVVLDGLQQARAAAKPM